MGSVLKPKGKDLYITVYEHKMIDGTGNFNSTVFSFLIQQGRFR
jgi:hypothetical protein